MNAVATKITKRIGYKKLTFTTHRGEIWMERVTDRDYHSRGESITDRDYNRFVALANSIVIGGQYYVRIEDANHGVAWSISRFAKN